TGRADRERQAHQRADALEPTLPKLKLVVPPSLTGTGLEVTRDGVPVASALWGTAVPVDPGEHVIKAVAPGKRSWLRKVQLGEGDTAEVRVPALEDAPDTHAEQPAATRPLPVADTPSDSGRTRRTVGLIVGGVGLVGIGVGTAFGVRAASKKSA